MNEPLPDEMRDAGANLISVLGKHQFKIRAAFWLFLSSPEEWRLFLVVPGAAATGRKAHYKKLLSILKKEGSSLSFMSLVVADPKDPLVQVLGKTVKVDHSHRVRMARSPMNAPSFEDTYIYRVGARAGSAAGDVIRGRRGVSA